MRKVNSKSKGSKKVRKLSLDVKLKYAQKRFNRLNGLRDELKVSKVKRIDEEYKKVGQHLDKLKKARVKKVPGNIRSLEKQRKKTNGEFEIASKDIKFIDEQISFLKTRLNQYEKERKRILTKKERAEEVLKKINCEIHLEKKIKKDL